MDADEGVLFCSVNGLGWPVMGLRELMLPEGELGLFFLGVRSLNEGAFPVIIRLAMIPSWKDGPSFCSTDSFIFTSELRTAY